MMVDECIRYKFAAELKDRTYESLRDVLVSGWFRYFGPPKIVICDQEGGQMHSRLCAMHTQSIGGSRVLTPDTSAAAVSTPQQVSQRNIST